MKHLDVSRRRIYQGAFCAVMLVLFIAMAIESRTFRVTAALFPLYTAAAGIVVTSAFLLALGVRVVRELREIRPDLVPKAPEPGPATAQPQSEQHTTSTFLNGLLWFALLVGFVTAVWLVGLLIAAVAWCALWLTYVYRVSIAKRLLASAILGAFLYGISTWAQVPIPSGILL